MATKVSASPRPSIASSPDAGSDIELEPVAPSGASLKQASVMLSPARARVESAPGRASQASARRSTGGGTRPSNDTFKTVRSSRANSPTFRGAVGPQGTASSGRTSTADVESAVPDARHQELAHRQERWAAEAFPSFMPIHLGWQDRFFDLRDAELQKPIPANQGYLHWATDLLGLTDKADRRDLLPAAHAQIASLMQDPMKATWTYRQAGARQQSASFTTDIAATLLNLGRFLVKDPSVGQAGAMFGGALAATVATQYMLSYLNFNMLCWSELAASEGVTARSRTIKDAKSLDDSLKALNDAQASAKALGLDIMAADVDPQKPDTAQLASQANFDFGTLLEPPTDVDVQRLKDAKKALTDAFTDRYITTKDHNSYYAASEPQSYISFARAVSVLLMGNLVRTMLPQQNTAAYTLAATIGALFLARTLSVVGAMFGETHKRMGSHAATLEVTPIERPPAGEASVKSASTYMTQAAIRMDHVKAHTKLALDGVTGKMAGLLGVEPDDVAGFVKHGGLKEILREGTPLSDEEQQRLAGYERDAGRLDAMTREQVVDWTMLSYRQGGELTPENKDLLARLDKKFKTSTVSAESFGKLDAQQRADADAPFQLVPGLPIPAQEVVHAGDSEAEVARKQEFNRTLTEQVKVGSHSVSEYEFSHVTPDQLADALRQDRANVSLRPRDHALRLALQAQGGGFVPPRAGDPDEVTATNVHSRLRDLAHTGASGNSAAAQAARGKIEQLRGLAREWADVKLDAEALQYDWNMLSPKMQQTVHDYFVADKSNAQLGFKTFMARASGDMLPNLYGRMGPALHWVVLGSQFPTLFPAALGIVSAALPQLTATVPGQGPTPEARGFNELRFGIQAGMIPMLAFFAVQGVGGLKNMEIRRQRNPKLVKSDVKKIPSSGQVARQEFLSTFFTMYFKQAHQRLVAGPRAMRNTQAMIKLVDTALTNIESRRSRRASPEPHESEAGPSMTPALPPSSPPVDDPKGKGKAVAP